MLLPSGPFNNLPRRASDLAEATASTRQIWNSAQLSCPVVWPCPCPSVMQAEKRHLRLEPRDRMWAAGWGSATPLCPSRMLQAQARLSPLSWLCLPLSALPSGPEPLPAPVAANTGSVPLWYCPHSQCPSHLKPGGVHRTESMDPRGLGGRTEHYFCLT